MVFIGVPYSKISDMTTTGEIVRLKRGDQHIIRLRGLGTAGYEWVYENSDRKIAGVQKAYADASESLSERNLGPSATEIFTITALQPGEVTLRFQQVRQWEPGKPPREEKLVKLIVD
jgi:predicted secreted protein